MVLWNKIAPQFNFNNRRNSFEERMTTRNGNSPYEKFTVAIFDSEEKLTEKPTISSSVQCGKFCITIDTSITVFENDTCENVILSMNFDSSIASYVFSKDGQFLFVILDTYYLFCFHLPNERQLIFIKNINEIKTQALSIKRLFLNDADNMIKIIIVTTNGAIFSLTDFDITKIIDTTYAHDVNKLNNIVDQINCYQLREPQSYEISHAISGLLLKEPVLLMYNLNLLVIWFYNNKYYEVHSEHGYLKVEIVDGYRLLVLSLDHSIWVVCPYTFLMMKISKQPVDDFLILREKNKKVNDILLVKSKNDGSATEFMIVSYPSFIHIFHMNIPHTVCLVNICDFIDSSILFVEENISTNDNTMVKVIIKVSALLPTEPTYSLQRLVRSLKFETAMEYAVKYNLPTEEIYSAKANLMLENLRSDENLHEIDIDLLIEHLKNVNNLEFIIDCCNKAVFLDYEKFKKLTTYVKLRLIEWNERSQSDIDTRFLIKINDMLKRLETYELIYFHTWNTKENIKRWLRFLNVNLLEEFKTHLRLGEFGHAILIWNRHFLDSVKTISAETLQEILYTIPDDTSVYSLFPWLMHFIPTISFISCDIFNEIIKWGLHRTRLLENQDDLLSWPESGIYFGDYFLKLIQFQDNNTLPQTEKQANFYPPLRDYKRLVENLYDLQELKKSHRMKVPLNVYLNEPIEVCYELLNRVDFDESSKLILNFLDDYICKNCLERDEVYTIYIKGLINRSERYWSWEDKAISVVEYIQDTQKRLTNVLCILRKASIPLSSDMANLAFYYSTSNHKLSRKINDLINNIKAAEIIKNYGFENIGLCNRLIFKIIKENQLTMVDDIIEITQYDSFMKQESFFWLTTHFFNASNLNSISALMDLLDFDQTVNLIGRLVNYIHIKCNNKNIGDFFPHLIELLQWIEYKFQKMYSQCTRKNLLYYQSILCKIQNLKLIYLLRKEFDIIATLSIVDQDKYNVFKLCFNHLLHGINTKNEDSVDEAVKMCEKLSIILKIKKVDALILLMEKFDTNRSISIFTHKLMEDPYLNEHNYKRLHFISLKILRDIKLDYGIFSFLKDAFNKLLITSPPAYLNLIITCNSWFKLTWEISPKTMSVSLSEINQWKLYDIYKDSSLNPDESLISFLRLILPMFQFFIEYSFLYNQNRNITVEESHIKSIENKVKNLCRRASMINKSHLLLLILLNLHSGCFSPSNIYELLVPLIQPVLHDLVNYELMKLINRGVADIKFGLVCLSIFSEKNAVKWITSLNTSLQMDPERNALLIALGLEYFRRITKKELYETFEAKALLHVWANELAQFSIPYKDVILSDTSSQPQIVERVMISSRKNLISLLRKFCTDFQFKTDDCLIIYLKNLVKMWNPKINISYEDGEREVTINKEEIDKIEKMCYEIMDNIINKAVAKEFILRLLPQVNFYHYEIILMLWNILGNSSELERSFIGFLQSYTRYRDPSPTEYKAWVNLSPDNINEPLPVLATYRLPFTHKIKQMDLILPELNLKTYIKWLEIVPILHIRQSIICTLAIKGEINEARELATPNKLSVKSQLYPTNLGLLEEILTCITYITGPDGPFYGTTILYYVFRNTPEGADQVAAIARCYEYTQWASKIIHFEPGLIEKIKMKYARCTLEHILKFHGLNANESLQFIDDPLMLVRNLYMNTSIPQRYRMFTKNSPDINAAIRMIDKVICLNLVKVKFTLLREWLQPDMPYTERHSETDVKNYNSNNCSRNEDYLLRARYMLEDEKAEVFEQYLLSIIFNKDNHYTRPVVQYRALQILISITKEKHLENLTRRDMNSIRRYMKTLEYLCDLENLGVTYDTVQSFERCCKRQLINQLFEPQYQCPLALTFIARLCLDYEIYDLPTWNKCIKLMGKFHMVCELIRYLPQLGHQSHIINSSVYVAGWNSITIEPFQKLDLKPTQQQVSRCVDALRILYRCPVVKKLNYNQIINYCFQSQLLHLATVLLPFLDENDLYYTLQMLENKNISAIIEDLQKLSLLGIMTVPNSIQIIKKELL